MNDAVDTLPPPLDANDDLEQQGTPALTPQSVATADGEATGREESSGEVRSAACGGGGGSGGRQQRGRDRDPNRGFSLSESDLTDGDTLDDHDDIHGSEMSVLDPEENDEAKEGSLAGDGGGGRSSGGRSPCRAAAEAEGGGDAGEEGSDSVGSINAGRPQSGGGGDQAGELVVGAATGDGNTKASTTAAAAAAAAAAGSTVPLSTMPSAASASSGPGARAREEGWSDRDLLLGLTRPEDNPVLAAHDVSRSVGGVVVKRGLLLVCRNAVYFIDGFGTEPMLPKPGAPPPSPAQAAVTAAAVAAAAGRSSADPLHGVRRLEEWELGGGAGGTGGGNDDGEVFGAKIKVTLRRDSQAEFSAAGGAGSKSAGTAVTAEQAGDATGGGGGGGRGGEVDEDDEILALGRVGVQRFTLDRIHAVYKRRYQLRDCGLEIFDVLGRSILVSFSTRAQQEEVLTYLLARGLPASIFSKGK